MRFILKFIFVGFFSLSFITILMNLVVNSPYGHKFISVLLENAVSDHTKLKLSIQNIEFKVIPTQINFSAVKLFLPEKNNQEILSISRLSGTFSWWSVVIGKPALDAIDIFNPSINLSNQIEKDDLLKNQMENKQKKEDDYFPINNINIYDMNIYSDRESPINVDKIPNTHMRIAVYGLTLHYQNERITWNIEDLTVKESDRFLFDHSHFSGVLHQNIKNIYEYSSHWILKSLPLNIEGKGTIDIQKGLSFQDLNLSGDLKVLGEFLNIPNTKGNIQGQFQFIGQSPSDPNDSPSMLITGPVTIQQGMIDSFLLNDITSDIEIDLDEIRFHNTKILDDQKKAEVLAEGKIGFADGTPFDFQGSLKGILLTKLLKSVKSDFNLMDMPLWADHLQISGQGKPFFLKAKSSAIRWNRVSLPSLNGMAEYACTGPINLNINSNDLLSFDKSHFSCSQGGFDFFGTLNLDKKQTDLSIKGKNIPLDQISNLLSLDQTKKINGNIESFKTKINGSFDDILTTIDFFSSKTKIGILNLDEVSGQLFFQGDKLSWKNINSQKMNSQKGFWNYKNDLYEAFFEIKNFHSFPFKKDFSLDINQAKGYLRGSLEKPLASKGEIQYSFSQIQFKDDLYLDQFKGHFIRNDQSLILSVDNATLKDFSYGGEFSLGPGKSHLISNEFEFYGDQKLNLKIKSNHHKNNLRSLAVLGPKIEQLGWDGFLGLNFTASGTLKKPNGIISGSLNNLSKKGHTFSPFIINGHFQNGPVNLSIKHDYEVFLLNAYIDFLKPKMPFTLDWKIHHWDIGSLISKIFIKNPKNYAYLSCQTQMKGFLQDIEKTEGSFKLDDLSIKISKKQDGEQQNLFISNERPASLLFNSKKWSFDSEKGFLLQSKGLTTNIFFTRPSHADSFHIRAETHLDLKLLPKVFDLIEQANGSLFISTDISGSLKDPKIEIKSSHSDTNSEKISLTFKDQKPAIQDISFDLEYQNGILNIKKIKGLKGSGSMTGYGTWSFFSQAITDQNKNNIFLSFKDIRNFLTIPYFKKFDTIVSGDIRITGDKTPYLLSGEIFVEKAYQSQFIDIQKEVIKAIQADKNILIEKDDPPIFLFDLSIKGNESIIINNKAMKVHLSSYLKLRGTDKTPSLLGTLSIDKGRFIFQQEFQVQHGNIFFDPSLSLDPRVEILSQAQIGPYKINLSFSGKTSDPQIGCSVDPSTREDGTPINKMDCLILLFQGVLPKDNDHSFSYARGVGMNSLVRFYADLIPIKEIIGQNDALNFYPDVTTTSDGRSIFRANAELRVVGGVVGTVTQSLDKISETKISLDIPINEGIRASVNKSLSEEENNDKKSFDLDLKFKFSFE